VNSVLLSPQHLGQVAYLPTYEAMQAFTTARTVDTPDALWICEHSPVYTQGLAGKTEHIFMPGDIPIVQTNRGGQVTYHGPGQVVAYPLLDLRRAGYFVKEYVHRIEEAVIRTLAHFGVTGHRVDGAPGIYVRLDDPGSHALLPQRPKKKVAISKNIAIPGGDVIPGSTRDPWIADQARNDSLDLEHRVQPQVAQPDFTGLGKIAALGIKVSRNCTYHGVALNVAMDLAPYSRINPCGYTGLQTVDLSTIGVSVSWQEAADFFSHKLATYLAP
jgi:lipoyl(octanoyl) transferase